MTSHTKQDSTSSLSIVRHNVGQSVKAPVMNNLFTGGRKTAIARVWLKPSQDNKYSVTINSRDLASYFPRPKDQYLILRPFTVTNTLGQFNVHCTVKGGGSSGQAGAVVLGIARALLGISSELRSMLKPHGLLTRDSRIVERKKPGQHGARKKTQFSKR